MIGIRSAASFDSTKDRKRSDDIHRLLDPSYSPSNHHQNTYAAYVDAHGDLHDPDYRQFPLINQSSRVGTWGLVDDESALHSDDDDDLPEDYYYNTRNSFSSSSARYSPIKTRQSQFQYSSTRRSNSPTYSPTHVIVPGASPISIFSSSSSSSSSVLSRAQTPVDSDDYPREKSRCSPMAALKRKRRRSSGATVEKEHEEERAKLARRTSRDYDSAVDSRRPSSVDDLRRHRFVEDVEEEDEEAAEQEDEESREEKGEWTPTCGDCLKKQWQALSLRVRFGVFRAEKRIKKRVQSLI